MAACPRCGGFLRLTVKNPAGGIMMVACPCTQTATPGRIPHPHQINYPPVVMQALQQASQAQKTALDMQVQASQHQIPG